MALEAVEAGLRRLGDELLLEVLGREAPHDVHVRARPLVDRALVPAAGVVDRLVDGVGAPRSERLHALDAAVRLHPVERQLHHVDREHLRHDVRRGVDDERHGARARVLRPLDAADRLVAADVRVGRVGVELQLVDARDAHEALALAGPDHLRAADLLRVRDRLLGPGARVDVVGGLALDHQVHRQHRELERGAAAEEQDLVRVRDREQLAEDVERLVVDRVVDLAAVAHLDERHPRVGVVDELGRRLLERRERQRARTGREIENPLRHDRHLTSSS